MTKILFLLSAALFTLSLVPTADADTFKCPSPFKPNTAAKLELIKGQLPNAGAMTNISQLSTMIGALQRDGMSKSLIVDHLIGAYCPMIAQDASLPDAEKAARVQRFTGEATRLVYSLESGLDILINVPLTPDVVALVTSAAKERGLSVPAWVAVTIDNALQHQSAPKPQ